MPDTAPADALKPLVCRKCHAVLAHTDGLRLVTPHFTVVMVIWLYCSECGEGRNWTPLARRRSKRAKTSFSKPIDNLTINVV